MAIGLSSIRDQLLPGLEAAMGHELGIRIESYVEFNTDVLVIMARWGDNRKMLKIARSEIEDGKHIAKIRDFVEMLMCASKGSVPVTQAQAAEMAQYQKLASQQPADWNGYGSDLTALVRKAVEDNQYKGEMGPIPEKVCEPTVEDLRRRMERKLDLGDNRGGDDGKT